MRTLFCILIVIMLSLNASAQCCDVSDKSGKFYLEPIGKVSHIQMVPAYWVGGKVGWKVTDHWSLGWAVNALISRNSPQHEHRYELHSPYLEMTYTGGMLSCSSSPINRLGFGFDLLFGAGWTELDQVGEDYPNYSPEESSSGTDPFTFFEPTGYVTFRYTPHFSINTGIGTLITSGIDRWGYTDADFYKVVWTAGVRVE